MSKIDQTFQNLCNEILKNGRIYENVNRGVKRLQIPSYTFRHSSKDGFPILSIKEVPFKSIVGELIWFLRGDTDIEYLNKNGIKIWNKDAYNWYVKKYSNNEPIKGQEEFYHNNGDGTYRMFTFEEFQKIGKGSVGQNYSAQWRRFNGVTDQIKDLIEGMKQDIMSSRLKVNAWNPSEINETALPPCHSEFQVIGVPLLGEKFGFELHWNQRSVDVFLGLPFNIASYALLGEILADITGYKFLGIEGTLKCVHFYGNQIEAAKELITRDPFKHLPAFVETPLVSQFIDLDEVFLDYEIEDFQLLDYTFDEAIKVEMLAPKSI